MKVNNKLGTPLCWYSCRGAFM